MRHGVSIHAVVSWFELKVTFRKLLDEVSACDVAMATKQTRTLQSVNAETSFQIQVSPVIVQHEWHLRASPTACDRYM